MKLVGIVNHASVEEAMNSLGNSFVIDKIFQLCKTLDETNITPTATLKGLGVELCPSLTGTLFGARAAAMSTAQALDAAMHTVHDISKSMSKLQYRLLTHSGPFVSRTAIDILQDGYDEPVYQQLGPLLGFAGRGPAITVKGSPGLPTAQEKETAREADWDIA